MYKRGPRTGKELVAYVDADWGTEVETRFNSTPISWRSKQQQSVALSSAEAEYMDVSDFTKAVIYL